MAHKIDTPHFLRHINELDIRRDLTIIQRTGTEIIMAIHTAGYYWVVQEPVFWTDRHWTLIGPQMVPANLHELFPLEKTFTILDTHSEFD